MDLRTYQVEVETDFLQKLSHVQPVTGLAELVWNALDADARRVEVIIDEADLGFEKIIVRDDGTGFSHADAPQLFGHLGNSWKRHKHVSQRDQRYLHGSEGQGRFKGLSIGRVATWDVVRAVAPSKYELFQITMVGDRPKEIAISDPQLIESAKPGVTVTIMELNKGYSLIKGAPAAQSLCEVFSSYLRSYRDVEIILPGGPLDPDAAIAATKRIELDDVSYGEAKYHAELELIDWKVPTERYLHFCDERGLSLSRAHLRLHMPGFNVSAHLKSPVVPKLAQDGVLGVEEMHPALASTVDRVGEEVKAFHRERLAEDEQSVVAQWKREDVYPYAGEPNNPVEAIERQVFDVVAARVSRHLPDFTGSSKKFKQFQFQLLRQAIEKSPEDLRTILTQVLDLPQTQRKDLADLLETISLSGIIAAAKLVADRLEFLAGLEKLVFDTEEKRSLKERRQLHRILVSRTWLFGEEFALSVDDQSLERVLHKHLESGGRTDVELLSPVLRPSGRRGIVDLMFSKRIPMNRDDEREHLIVELKAPKVKVGSKEVNQVKEYARAVAGDERFREVTARWEFWLLANEYDDMAGAEAHQSGRPRGLLFQQDDPPLRIWLKTWGQVIEDNRARLRFVQKELDYEPNQGDALERLKQRHADLFAALSSSPDGEVEEEPAEAKSGDRDKTAAADATARAESL